MADILGSIPLGSIRVFEAAARRLSFTEAAEELGMTQAAVSWQVKSLEARLGQPLFLRQARGVALTSPGARLAAAATPALQGLRAALAEVAAEGQEVLAITSLQTVASQWLAPRLGAFQLANPQLAVRLETDVRVADLRHESFDVAIRTGDGAWPGVESVRLFPSVVTPLCTAATLAGLDLARGPGVLLEVHRLGLEAEWGLWFEAAGVQAPSSEARAGTFAADAQTLEVAAAVAGQGAVLASPIMFAPQIAAGVLVQPFPLVLDLGRSVWLAYAAARRGERKIRAFRDWMVASAAEDPVVAAYLGPPRPPG